MQNKKGIYLLLAFIGTILVFFCILFFVHERTLENGILFKVSFNYENAQDITYNFYNQSGKIEKIETGDGYKNSLFLEKTDYKSVKLLRRLLKNLKEKKEPTSDIGITIYNGQNKRYYLLPFDSEAASELSDLIIDGYIHSEMNRITKKDQKKELYLYEKEDTLAWTTNGAEKRIIHTYQCSSDFCQGIYSDSENNEKVLLDEKLYLYNYITRAKEEINTEAEITNVKLLKYQDQLRGLELINKNNQSAYYDLSQKEVLTSFQNQNFSFINNDLLLEVIKTTNENETDFSLRVWNRFTKKEIWKSNIIDQNNTIYSLKEQKNDNITYYILERTSNKKTTYQVLDAEWNRWKDWQIFESVELTSSDTLLVGIQKDNQIVYEEYDKNGIKVIHTEENNMEED